MAVAPSKGRSEQLIQLQRKCKERDDNTNTNTSPQKLKNCTNINNITSERSSNGVVPVVYYLSRKGQLEHPHFMELPLSSSHGLFLRDVINRLNLLRGKGMGSQYSWSSKRSYKNGYVWQDLEENDLIHPLHGGEIVLKGSEILETPSYSVAGNSPGDSEFPAARNRRRNQSWAADDLHNEYKVFKAESTREFADKAAADASTQTDDKRRRIKAEELRREEISPPPSDSSPETLESLMKSDGRIIIAVNQGDDQSETLNPTAGDDDSCPTERMKASSVLMSLISCGSTSFRGCGATSVKEEHGNSLVYRHKMRLPRGGNQTDRKDYDEVMTRMEIENFGKMGIMEQKEYFSGSLIETTNKLPALKLKRSSSYNADRHQSSHVKMVEKKVEGERAKCIPRKSKTQTSTKKECQN